MNTDNLTKIQLLEKENKKLKKEFKKLSEWNAILTDSKLRLQQKILVLESSIKNFGKTIDDDLL